MSDNLTLSTRWALGLLLVGAVALLIIFAAPLLESLLIAALLAYLLDAPVRWLTVRFRGRRNLAVWVTYLSALTLAAGMPTLIGTAAFFWARTNPIDWSQIEQFLQAYLRQPMQILGLSIQLDQTILENLQQSAGNALTLLPGGSLNVFVGLTNNLLWGAVIVVSLYYFLKDGAALRPWLVGLFPAAAQPDVTRLLVEIDRVWGTFLRVQVLIFLILTGLMTVGTLLVLWLFETLLPFSWWLFVLLLVVVYTLVQQVDNLYLRPRWLGRTLKLHPGVAFVALLAALALSGVLGALLVLPFLATLQVLARYVHRRLLGLPGFELDAMPPAQSDAAQGAEDVV
ncbi:MAG: AI-2E family transporter [Anaerolineales bacterium]